jgi:ABC-type transport system substrate-binding protein
MRDRMRWLVVALAAVLIIVVVGTVPAAKDTLVIGIPSDVPIFDTHEATGLHNGGVLNQVSEPLVRLTTDGRVVPWLVESWEQRTILITGLGLNLLGDGLRDVRDPQTAS